MIDIDLIERSIRLIDLASTEIELDQSVVIQDLIEEHRRLKDQERKFDASISIVNFLRTIYGPHQECDCDPCTLLREYDKTVEGAE